MNPDPIDIRFSLGSYTAELNLTLSCPQCHAKGEPSNMIFEFLNGAWTETKKTVAVPCVCEECGCGVTLLLKRP